MRCSDCNWARTQNHLVFKRTLNHLAKLAKWLSCVLCTYLYGGIDCMYLVLVMSRTRFRVNPHSIVAWMSRNSLLEAGAKSEALLFYTFLWEPPKFGSVKASNLSSTFLNRKRQNETCAVRKWFKIAPQAPNIKTGKYFILCVRAKCILLKEIFRTLSNI